MELNVVYELINECFLNPLVLQKGYEFLSKYSSKDGFFVKLVELTISPQYQIEIRNFGGIILKNMIRQQWTTLTLPIQQKELIISSILKAIYISEKQIQFSLNTTLAFICQAEFPNIIPILQHIATMMKSLNREELECSLNCYILIIENCDNRFGELTGDFLAYFPLIMEIPNLTEKIYSKCLFASYLSIKSISWAVDTNPDIINKTIVPIFKDWIGILIKIEKLPINSGMDVRRNALRILTILCRDFEEFITPYIEIIFDTTLKLILLNYQIYIENAIMKKENLEAEDIYESEDLVSNYGIGGLSNQLLELISTIITVYSLPQQIISQNIPDFIYVLSSYMQISAEQEELFVTDPNLYFADDQDDAAMNSIRNNILALLNTLIDRGFGGVLIALEITIGLFLSDTFNNRGNRVDIHETNFDNANFHLFYALEPQSAQYLCKRKEVGLYLLGAFYTEIIQNKNENINLYVEKIVTDIVGPLLNTNSVSNIMKARIFSTLSQLSHYIQPTSAIQKNILIYTITNIILIKESPFVLKLCAYPLFAKLLRRATEDTKVELNGYINGINMEIIDLISWTNEDTLHIPIQTITILVKLFPEEQLNTAQNILLILQKLLKEERDSFILDDLREVLKAYISSEYTNKLCLNILLPEIRNILHKLSTNMISSPPSTHNIPPTFLDIQTIDLLPIFIKHIPSNILLSQELVSFIPLITDILGMSKEPSLLISLTRILAIFLIMRHSEILDEGVWRGIGDVGETLLMDIEGVGDVAVISLGYVVYYLAVLGRVNVRNYVMLIIRRLEGAMINSLVQSLLLAIIRIFIGNWEMFEILCQIATKEGMMIILNKIENLRFLSKLLTMKSLEPLEICSKSKILNLITERSFSEDSEEEAEENSFEEDEDSDKDDMLHILVENDPLFKQIESFDEFKEKLMAQCKS